MSLATRCTTCGTVFRVVQDQLKISEGWVRCGRCNEVFNALEGLFDLERDAPPEWQGAQPTAAVASAPGEVDLPLPVSGDDPDAAPGDPFLVDRIDAELFGRQGTTAAPPPPAPKHKPKRPVTQVQLPRPGSHLDLEPPDPREPVRYEPSLSRRDQRDLPDIDLSRVETLEVEPEFIRRAEDIARWRRSPRRMMLAGVALLLAAGLTAQWTIHFRDFVAARWPDTAPLLARVCAGIGCTLQPLKRIEAITVEASALARAGAAPDAFRLSVTLRNRETMVLAMPSIDLTLTDGSGVLVARRALSPQDFRVASAVLQPQSEQAMQLVLSAGNPRVSGYTVEVFYP